MPYFEFIEMDSEKQFLNKVKRKMKYIQTLTHSIYIGDSGRSGRRAKRFLSFIFSSL